LTYDYTTIGHVTIDVLADGSRQPGGSALYSALQAARLGRRTRIVTQGHPDELEELLDPYRAELDITVLPAEQTTTLLTTGSGEGRRQRVLAWAGPLAQDLDLESAILHLAPVARETPTRWSGRAGFVGLTPQGLARQWSGEDGEMSLGSRGAGTAAAPQEEGSTPGRGVADALGLATACDAIVVSREERGACADLIAAGSRAGAIVAMTAGPDPATILLPDGSSLQSPVPPIERPGGDLGAGDVFAAALFVMLADRSPPAPAAAFASAAAAVRMRGSGPHAVGGRQAIEELLQQPSATGADVPG
jgi:sugar/nucleoside kinase (ribokinase family)